MATLYYAWRTQFSDPGILDPYLSYTSIKTQLLFQFSDDEEETANTLLVVSF